MRAWIARFAALLALRLVRDRGRPDPGRLGRIASLGLLVALSGCSGPLPPEERVPPPPAPAVGEFSAERAWGHLQALAEIGPRTAGSDGAARARAYIADQLAALALDVERLELEIDFESPDVPPITLVNLSAVLPGESKDEIVLAAPYDTSHYEGFEFAGVNEGASGAALLLELARVLKERPPPYTTRFVFLDGEGRLGRGDASDRELHFLGSSSQAQAFETDGVAERIRLLVVFDRVADADLRIARDVRSNRMYRDEFWRAARRLGHTEAFRGEAQYETVDASHVGFLESGLRRVVALVDTHYGEGEAPGAYAQSEEDTLAHCSPESLGVVGTVTLEALDAITTRLVKIDRFARAPVTADVEPELPAGETDEASGAATDAPGTPSGAGPEAEVDPWADPSGAPASDEPISDAQEAPEEEPAP